MEAARRFEIGHERLTPPGLEVLCEKLVRLFGDLLDELFFLFAVGCPVGRLVKVREGKSGNRAVGRKRGELFTCEGSE